MAGVRSCRPAAGSGSLNCVPRFKAGFLAARPSAVPSAYQALHKAHRELEEAQRQRVETEKLAALVAGIAQELSNPISVVLGNAHSLTRYLMRLKIYLDGLHDDAPSERLAEMRRELRVDRILEDLKPMVAGTVECAERAREGLKDLAAISKKKARPST
jgi:two-component system sensor histidine kinase HupT/HoxJ